MKSINHGNQQYVRGVVHTNTIESFWSLLKRGVMGSFHKVSATYSAVISRGIFFPLQ